LGSREPGTQFDPPEAERSSDPVLETVIEWQIALSSAVRPLSKGLDKPSTWQTEGPMSPFCGIGDIGHHRRKTCNGVSALRAVVADGWSGVPRRGTGGGTSSFWVLCPGYWFPGL